VGARNELWERSKSAIHAGRAAERTLCFSQAVRAADPKARLIATGQDPDHFVNGTRACWPASGRFDFMATHFVVGNGAVRRRDATPDFIAASALALPVDWSAVARDEEADRRSGQPVANRLHRMAVPCPMTPCRASPTWRRAVHGGLLNTLMRVADFTPSRHDWPG